MSFRDRLRIAKTEITALTVALRHPRTPWYAKAWLLLVVGYALSPLDLIPDPIPVLGYLDDAILLPLGVLLAIKMIPTDVLAECRQAPPRPPLPAYIKLVGIVLVVAAWAITLWLGVRAVSAGRNK